MHTVLGLPPANRKVWPLFWPCPTARLSHPMRRCSRAPSGRWQSLQRASQRKTPRLSSHSLAPTTKSSLDRPLSAASRSASLSKYLTFDPTLIYPLTNRKPCKDSLKPGVVGSATVDGIQVWKFSQNSSFDPENDTVTAILNRTCKCSTYKFLLDWSLFDLLLYYVWYLVFRTE